MLTNFLVWMLQCIESLIFHLFCPLKKQKKKIILNYCPNCPKRPKARNQFYEFPSISLIAYSRVHLNFATAKILSATAVETLEIDCCQEKKLQHTAVLVSDMVGRNLARTVIGHD